MAGTCAVSGNPFSASSLINYMEASLPASLSSSSDNEEEAGVTLLQTPYEAIALLCHACMLAVGFRLIGLGEDHKLGMLSVRLPAGLVAHVQMEYHLTLPYPMGNGNGMDG